MCEQTEIKYLDKDIVWVKLGSCWWPGEVVGKDRLPPDLLVSFRKPPIAVVKFFQEDAYEYVKNINSIYKYNCSRKHEFIKKGLDTYRAKHGPMEKFPEDVIRAETATGGDIEILTRDEYQEEKKQSYAGLFGEPVSKKTPLGRRGRKSKEFTPVKSSPSPRKVTSGNPDYQAHILLQKTAVGSSEKTEGESNSVSSPPPSGAILPPVATTPVSSTPGIYSCHACPFTTIRLNVMIIHNKTHSVGYVAYTPSPVRKKPSPKAKKSPKKLSTSESTPSTSKLSISTLSSLKSSSKPKRPKKDLRMKERKTSKRPAEHQASAVEVKKQKTDVEIKNSLLADWDDGEEDDEEVSDEAPLPIERTKSPVLSKNVPASPDSQPPCQNLATSNNIKDPEPDCRFEFHEEEEWSVENTGKIPRVKKNSRKESDSIDDIDMAKEVAELLEKTTVPELPSAPDSIKVQENFPEGQKVKSPDKPMIPSKTHSPEIDLEGNKKEVPPQKVIFKTKTFFRSRHTRSQDAIEKYVAEQLNAAERMDIADADNTNGSDSPASPENRASPVDLVKTPRLAPKIELKKLNAQLKEESDSPKPDTSDSLSIIEELIPQIDDNRKETKIGSTYKEETTNKDITLIERQSETKQIENTNLPNDSHEEITTNNLSLSTTPKKSPCKISKITSPVSENYELQQIDEPPESAKVEVLNIQSPPQISYSSIEDSIKPIHVSPKKVKNKYKRIRKSIEQIDDQSELKIFPQALMSGKSSFKETIDEVPQVNLSDSIENNQNEIQDNDFYSSQNPSVISTKQDDLVKPIDSQNDIHISSPQKIPDILHKSQKETKAESQHIEESPTIVYEIQNKVEQENLNDSVNGNQNKVCDEVNDIVLQTEHKNSIIDESQIISQELSEMMNETEENKSQNETFKPQESNKADLESNATLEKDKKDETYLEITQDNIEPSHDNNVNVNAESSFSTCMSESTASAVDALLSVSREADRVTKHISSGPPEEIFEDDSKFDNHLNGYNDQTEKLLHNNFSCTPEPSQLKTKDSLGEVPFNIVSRDVDHSLPMVPVQVEPDNTEKAQDVIKRHEPLRNEPVDSVEKGDDMEMEQVLQQKENVPTESDLQIAEALINLPSTAIQINAKDIDANRTLLINNNVAFQETSNFVKVPEEPHFKEFEVERKNAFESCTAKTDLLLSSLNKPLEFMVPESKPDNETEYQKNENLNAAESLVQMSEFFDHKAKEEVKLPDKPITTPIVEKISLLQKTIGKDISKVFEPKSILAKTGDTTTLKNPGAESHQVPSKLMQILEEPRVRKSIVKTPSKPTIIQGKEGKILNFNVSKGSFKPAAPVLPSKQKIIIRRSAPNKNLLNALTESAQEKIILSRSKKPNAQDTYTIETTPDSATDVSTIIIQQKLRKIQKPISKLQKIAPQTSILTTTAAVAPISHTESVTKQAVTNQPSDESMFDINSMPIVLSDDLLTPESIEKMPIIMSDGNVSVTSAETQQIKPTPAVEPEKPVEAPKPPIKKEVKTLLINTSSEKSVTPNILCKSSKLRGAKPMLIVDKQTGKQKIIMAKPQTEHAKEVQSIKPVAPKSPVATQAPVKSEKFIILPTSQAKPQTRTQKIVIDPQTGKAHVLVSKPPETNVKVAQKQLIPKIVPTTSDLPPNCGAGGSGGTVMIITNAQGGQSRIVLTPEHEKLLFPNKTQTVVTQVKAIPPRTQTSSIVQKQQIIVNSSQQIVAKPQQRIITKQKNAIITSKGQLIVTGGRLTTAQSSSPGLPELKPAPAKKMIPNEITKNIRGIRPPAPNEPLIFLKQQSGAVMQLTVAQFEHLKKTGQIVQKMPGQTKPTGTETKTLTQTLMPKTTTKEILPMVQKKVRTSRPMAATPVPAKRTKTIGLTQSLIQPSIAPAPMSTTVPIAPSTPSVPTPTKALAQAMPALAPLTMTPAHSPAVSNIVPASVAPPSNPYSELDNIEDLLPSTAIARQIEPPQPPPQPVPDPTPTPLTDGQLLAVPGENFGGPPGSFYLCVEDNGTLTPIDNRPLVLENNQLVPMAEDVSRQLILVGSDGLPVEPVPEIAPQPEHRDILAAALANTDVFIPDGPRDEAPDFRDLNANVSVHCRVSETSTTLNQPIMSPLEVPSKLDTEPTTVPSSIEDGLAVIGVTTPTVPTSLELPITVTDPRIALKTTDPLSGNNYHNTLLPSPSTEIIYTSVEEEVHSGPISMPLLTEEDEGIGKSMPILTDEVTERTASSVESTIGSPSSADVVEDGTDWSRRLLTPGSDSSENSAEIPIQPALQLSVHDISHTATRNS